MITLLPPLPMPAQPGDPRQGPQPGQGGDGNLFEQVLASIGGAPPIDAAPPVSVGAATGPAAVLTDPLPVRTLPTGETHELAPVAAIFDQFGFFGHASGLGTPGEGGPLLAVWPGGLANVPTTTPEAPGAPSSEPQPLDTVPSIVPPGHPVYAPPEPQSRGVSQAEPVARPASPLASAPAEGPDPIPAPAVMDGQAVRMPPRALPAATSLPVAELAANDEEGPAAPLASRSAPRRAPPGACARVEIALHELEQGLHIAARIDGLDEGERRRMHDEIVSLLAEHGVSARSIQISGRPMPRVRQGNPT